MSTKHTMDKIVDEFEDSKNFLELLKKYKESETLYTLHGKKRDNKYYELETFKTYICELFYNAVQYFPHISEYTIECTNDKGVSTLSMGYYTELDDDNEMCLAKIKNKHFEMCLNKTDVQSLYIANRASHPEINETVNLVISSLYSSGYEPHVKTYFKSVICNSKPVKKKIYI
jgi:Ca2+-dependent lipid-binding protein